MLSLRLQRVGRKHDPSYRIVATDSRSGPKTNKHVAILGHYDAIRKTTKINDPEEVKKYLGFGAKVTDTLYNIFVSEGLIEGKKKNVLPKKSPIIDEEALAREAEEKAAAEAAAAEAEAAKEAEEASEESTEEAEAPAEEEASTEEQTEEAPAEEESTEEAPEEAASEESTPADDQEDEEKKD